MDLVFLIFPIPIGDSTCPQIVGAILLCLDFIDHVRSDQVSITRNLVVVDFGVRIKPVRVVLICERERKRAYWP